MFGKDNKGNTAPVAEIVKTPKNESSFSVFQIVIFAFLFVLMIWIIGFLSLELDGQKQQIKSLNDKVGQIEKGGVELLESYIEKIRDLQKVDIKDQVQQFGMDLKENLQHVRELMFDKNDLAQLNAKIKALEEYNNTYRGTNLLMLTSVSLLRDAINRGDNFKVELDTLSDIASKNKVIAENVKKLEPFAETGIKTVNQLRNEFDALADDIVFMANNPNGEGDSIRERFLFRVKSLLKVRKIDFEKPEVEEENTPDYIVNKTQKLLSENNLSGALAEFEKLKTVRESGFNYAKKWFDDAKVKLSVNDVIAPLMQEALEKALHDVEVKIVKPKKITLVEPKKEVKVEPKIELKPLDKKEEIIEQKGE